MFYLLKFKNINISFIHSIILYIYIFVLYIIENHPNDCYARNAYGLLLQRQKLYKSAAEQFAVAVCNSINNKKDLVCVNLAHVLIKLKKYNEAIKLCQTVQNINYNSQCHLALALFKGNYIFILICIY